MASESSESSRGRTKTCVCQSVGDVLWKCRGQATLMKCVEDQWLEACLCMLHLVPFITEIESRGLVGLWVLETHILHLIYSSSHLSGLLVSSGCHRKKTYSSFRLQCKLHCYSKWCLRTRCVVWPPLQKVIAQPCRIREWGHAFCNRELLRLSACFWDLGETEHLIMGHQGTKQISSWAEHYQIHRVIHSGRQSNDLSSQSWHLHSI